MVPSLAVCIRIIISKGFHAPNLAAFSEAALTYNAVCITPRVSCGSERDGKCLLLVKCVHSRRGPWGSPFQLSNSFNRWHHCQVFQKEWRHLAAWLPLYILNCAVFAVVFFPPFIMQLLSEPLIFPRGWHCSHSICFHSANEYPRGTQLAISRLKKFDFLIDSTFWGTRASQVSLSPSLFFFWWVCTFKSRE